MLHIRQSQGLSSVAGTRAPPGHGFATPRACGAGLHESRFSPNNTSVVAKMAVRGARPGHEQHAMRLPNPVGNSAMLTMRKTYVRY
jgi:hypothetical protein